MHAARSREPTSFLHLFYAYYLIFHIQLNMSDGISQQTDKIDRPLAMQEDIASEKMIEAGETRTPQFATCSTKFYIFMLTLGSAFAVSFQSAGILLFVPRYNMSLIWTTNVNIICLCIGTFLNILIAQVGDKLSGPWAKWGRRKPFVASAIPFFVISALMLAFPATKKGAPEVLEIWFLVGMLLNTIAASLFFIPISSWFIESCECAEEYRSIRAVQFVAQLIGAIMAQIMLSAQAQAVAAAFVLFILPVFSILMLCYVPGKVLKNAPEQPPLIPSFRSCIRTKEFRSIFMNSTLLNIAQSGASEFLFIILYTSFGLKTLDDVSAYFIPVLLFVMFGNLVSIGVLISVLKKRDKLQVFRFLMLALIFLGILWFMSLLPTIVGITKPAYVYGQTLTSNGILQAFLIIFLACFALSGIVTVACFFIQSIFVRDLIVFDTFTNYINRENVYQTAMGVPSSLLSSVVSNFFIGVIYSTGYHAVQGKDDKGNFYSDSSILSVKYSWNNGTIFQSAVYLLFFSVAIGYSAYWIMSDYGLTSEIASQMEKVNTKREEAKNTGERSKVVSDSNPLNAIVNAESSESGEASTEKDYLAPPSGKIAPPSGKSNSTKSNNSLPPFDEVVSPFSDDDEKNIMMHFSALENKVIYESRSSNTDDKNEGLNRIHNSILLGGFCIGPIAMIALLWGVLNQIKRELDFATLLLTLFLAMSIYVGYEILRFNALKKLYNLPGNVVHTLAQRQVYRNANYSVSLKELLDSHAIGDDITDPDPNVDDGLVSRFTFVKKADRRSITEDVPEEEEHHKLSGYKRIYSVCTVLLVAGILAILQKTTFKVT